MINENGWIPEDGIIENKELKEKLFVFIINHPTFLGVTCSATLLLILLTTFIVTICKYNGILINDHSDPLFMFLISIAIFVLCIIAGVLVEGVLIYKRKKYYGLD